MFLYYCLPVTIQHLMNSHKIRTGSFLTGRFLRIRQSWSKQNRERQNSCRAQSAATAVKQSIPHAFRFLQSQVNTVPAGCPRTMTASVSQRYLSIGPSCFITQIVLKLNVGKYAVLLIVVRVSRRILVVEVSGPGFLSRVFPVR